MRPYVAIIVDSFREALGSRVLWVLLALITLFLLALAPLGVSHPVRTALSGDDIRDFSDFAKTLRAAGRRDENTPQRAILDNLSGDLRDELREIATAETRDRRVEFRVRRKLVGEFNEWIDSEDPITPEQLENVSFRKEGQALRLRSDELSETERKRLHRLAIDAFFRRDLKPVSGEAVQFHYLGFDVGSPQPISRNQLQDGVKLTVAGFMNLVAETLGIFIAILVTASIIPNMFDTGSVNLLFSKPIVRSLMYLSKFVGGLSFILISATYLIAGVWVIVGLRFGVWHQKLLYVIPILMFLFGVYYSVSAFAGVVWRNTIMAIAAACGLWAVCLGLGWTHDFMDLFGNQARRVIKAVDIGDGILTIAESGEVKAWSEKDREWKTVFEEDSSGGGPPAFTRQNSLLGPIYDGDQQRVLAIDRNFSQSELLAGYDERDWGREEVDAAPSGCIAFMRRPDGDFYVVERQGISRFVETEVKKNLPINIFGFKYKIGPKRSSFQPAGPMGYELAAKATSAAMNPDDGSIVIYGEGTLHRLVLNDESKHYELATATEILDVDAEALVASAGKWVALIDESAVIRLLDIASLEEIKSIETFTKTRPRFVSAAPNGRFLSVVCHNRRIFVYDIQEERVVSSRVHGQGDITSGEFIGPNRMLVTDRIDRVREIDMTDGRVANEYSPRLSVFDKVFHWVVTPLYKVFPNPGKLKDTSDYLLTEQESVAITGNQSLTGSRVQIDPWPPVWKSGIFTLVMLSLACFFIHRQEF